MKHIAVVNVSSLMTCSVEEITERKFHSPKQTFSKTIHFGSDMLSSFFDSSFKRIQARIRVDQSVKKAYLQSFCSPVDTESVALENVDRLYDGMEETELRNDYTFYVNDRLYKFRIKGRF